MKVFISHSYTDELLVKRIVTALKMQGFQVWDHSQILLSESLVSAIDKALEESDLVIVLITPQSINSPYVEREISYVLGEKRYKGRVLPVVAASIDELREDQIPWVFKLNLFQRIRVPNLAEDDEDVEKIVQAIQAIASPISA